MPSREPRLLAPDASGTPALFRASSDPAVVAEFADPAVSLVVYQPRWTEAATDAFNRAACQSPSCYLGVSGIWKYKSQYQRQSSGTADGFIRKAAEAWLEPLFGPEQAEQKADVCAEVAAQQILFTTLLRRFAQLGRNGLNRSPLRGPHIEHRLRHYSASDKNRFSFDPARPNISRAHTDEPDVGLFSHPLGTVVVDHAGLVPDSVGKLQKDGDYYTLMLSRIEPQRLWRLPEGSFAAWHGSGHPNKLFHFFPVMKENGWRNRMFVKT